MEAAQRREGDALADKLIARYWHDLEFRGTWNYYLSPVRYVAGDRWATEEQRLDIAQRLVERDTHFWTGLEILLGHGLTEYLPRAQEEARTWLKAGGYDAYHLFDILKCFPPDDPVRQAILGARRGHVSVSR